ncbi:MAG TPA: hypothetical protein VGB37_01065 [Candidatus Lokiarchaeia archaeon]
MSGFDSFLSKLKDCGIAIDEGLEAFLYLVYQKGFEEGKKSNEQN